MGGRFSLPMLLFLLSTKVAFDTSFHCWRATNGLIDTREAVVREMQGNQMATFKLHHWPREYGASRLRFHAEPLPLAITRPRAAIKMNAASSGRRAIWWKTAPCSRDGTRITKIRSRPS
jgi:hypothetical protein